MGKALPVLDEALRVPAVKVDGCASQVWLVPKVDGTGKDAVITFQGASDAMIVQGLIAILTTLISGKTAGEIVEIDALSAFGQLGLDQHLSAQRSNGLRAMIERVGAIAQTAINS